MIRKYELRTPSKAIRYNGKNLEKIKNMCPKETNIYVGLRNITYVDGMWLDVGSWVVLDALDLVTVYEAQDFRKLLQSVKK